MSDKIQGMLLVLTIIGITIVGIWMDKHYHLQDKELKASRGMAYYVYK